MPAVIFRSADPGAEQDAQDVCSLLRLAGLNPELLNQDAPGVPPGTFVVQVPAEQEPQAEAALNLLRNFAKSVDNSAALDLVDVFVGTGTSAEMEAMTTRAVLDSEGIPSIIVGVSQLPYLPFVVKVPRNAFDKSMAALAAAQQAGPAAAEEAAQATEAPQ